MFLNMLRYLRDKKKNSSSFIYDLLAGFIIVFCSLLMLIPLKYYMQVIGISLICSPVLGMFYCMILDVSEDKINTLIVEERMNLLMIPHLVALFVFSKLIDCIEHVLNYLISFFDINISPKEPQEKSLD